MLKKKLFSLGLFVSFCSSLFAETVYIEPPKDFRKKMEVAGCFYEQDGKVLFLLRNPNKPQGNTWGIPGGKIDQGETPKEAVVREFYEETGVTLDSNNLEYSGKVYITSEKADFVFHVFKAHSESGYPDVTLSPMEHIDYKWLSLDEAMAMPLIPGEEECINYFYAETRNA